MGVRGQTLRVPSVGKIEADFKYRNKIGLDVAPEALREVPSGAVLQHDESGRCCSSAILLV